MLTTKKKENLNTCLFADAGFSSSPSLEGAQMSTVKVCADNYQYYWKPENVVLLFQK